MKIKLQHVHYMPQELEPGILYISKEFETAAHLCPCGCGSKIRTPLGSTEWSYKETNQGPSLYPSVGNWQQECQSHYWIRRGKIVWSKKWTQEEIEAGRRAERKRREEYYNNLYTEDSILKRVWKWIKDLFNH